MSDQRYVVEQALGIHDMHGHEIYEGEIVDVTIMPYQQGIVEYQHGSFGVMQYDTHKRFQAHQPIVTLPFPKL